MSRIPRTILNPSTLGLRATAARRSYLLAAWCSSEFRYHSKCCARTFISITTLEYHKEVPLVEGRQKRGVTLLHQSPDGASILSRSSSSARSTRTEKKRLPYELGQVPYWLANILSLATSHLTYVDAASHTAEGLESSLVPRSVYIPRGFL